MKATGVMPNFGDEDRDPYIGIAIGRQGQILHHQGGASPGLLGSTPELLERKGECGCHSSAMGTVSVARHTGSSLRCYREWRCGACSMTTSIDYRAATKYFGNVARRYEERRSKKGKWASEQEAVAAYVQGLPQGARLADVPFGTGRFAPLYMHKGLRVFGADISKDMLAIAEAKIAGNENFQIVLAPAESLPLSDNAVDYLICHRFIKWLPNTDAITAVMKEFARVTRCEMLIQVKLNENERGVVHRLARLIRRKVSAIKTQALSRDTWESIVEGTGFSIKDVRRPPGIDDGLVYYILESIAAEPR